MSGYIPTKIAGFSTGLVQEREEFILPDDAYPTLENAFVWRERIKRRQGLELLGRLRRTFLTVSLGNSGASPWTFTIFATVVPPINLLVQPNAEIEPGSVVITIGGVIFTDQGDGTLTSVTVGNSGVINYITGVVTLTTTVAAGTAATIDYNYFPGLPVMGIRTRELNSVSNEMMVVFDQVYAYRFSSTGFVELAPGTTWTGDDDDFFWTTNYWVDASNDKLFWATNASGTAGDPIRYYNGSVWTNFAPQINSAADLLNQCLAMLPFRGRLLAFNTLEGANLALSTSFLQRIRWSAIGSPITTNAWRDDIPGQGGFLDIPTSESITSVGFVRDNLVIYCERSTWQLRYTGRSIAPFQIEKVNSELGAASTFSAVQFDTSLVGIGDKGIVECDSYKSSRIDIKIPDLVFEFDNENNGPKRIQGIRDFQQRLAYWIYPYTPGEVGLEQYYPNRRLVYNYENDSWAIFTDSLTALGTYQPPLGISWSSPAAKIPWTNANFPWIGRPSLFPAVMGGNQQGFVMYLGSNLTPKVTNDVTLTITAITGNTTTPTVITSPDHNLITGQVISINDIPSGTPFDTLNLAIFGIVVVDEDTFQLWVYNPVTDQFTIPQTDAPATYVGGGKIAVRDGFAIQSKKFNNLDEGENIQVGYIDVLMSSTDEGAISLFVLLNYNENSPVNTLPQNVIPVSGTRDDFFNVVVPTTQTSLGGISGSKYWQRVYCPVRGAFVTLVWTLSNSQLVGVEQESNVQIDAQILWSRKAGRLGTF